MFQSKNSTSESNHPNVHILFRDSNVIDDCLQCGPGLADKPSGAYGLIPIKASYSGPVFQASRSSDYSTQDFYAHPDGSYWTTVDSTGQRIGEWLNGAAAYCAKWYDQSGAGNHATQANAQLQPIVDYTNFAMDFTAGDGKAYFALPTGTVPQSIAYTVTVRHGLINHPLGGWLGGGALRTNGCNAFRREFSAYVNYWYLNDFSAGFYFPGNIITHKYDGTLMEYMYTNGTLTASVAKGTGWAGVSGNEFMGRTISDAQETLNGTLNYIYIFKSNLTDAKRSLIEAGAYGKLSCPFSLFVLFYMP